MIPSRRSRIEQTSIATLLATEVGKLAANLIALAEHTSVTSFRDAIEKRYFQSHLDDVIDHMKRIGVNNDLLSDEKFVSSVVVAIKSSPFSEIRKFLSHISRNHPRLQVEIEKDPVIKNRIDHIIKVCLIAEIFSDENIRRLTRGISEIHRNIYTTMESTRTNTGE